MINIVNHEVTSLLHVAITLHFELETTKDKNL
jgi:hypothetical protein